MSAPANCNPCCSTDTTTQVPGPPGTGTAGLNAFTTLVSATFQLRSFGAVTITVGNNQWAAVGQSVLVSDQVSKYGTLLITAIPAGTTQITGIWQNYTGEQTSGTITSGIVTPSAVAPAIGAPPASLTDNTTGTASTTLAAGAGVQTLAFFVNLTDLGNQNLITTYTLGYAFKILGVSFIVDKPVTTGSKLATLTPAINGANITGGVLSLTSANCTPAGTVVAGSNVTGANTGSNSATLTITGSSVTAFAEGTGWIVIQVQNMDTANAISSLASATNSLIAALLGAGAFSGLSFKNGTFVANGTSTVTVAQTGITAHSVVIICLMTVGGTVGAIPTVKTITPGTGFTVVGTASDTSTYQYYVIG